MKEIKHIKEDNVLLVGIVDLTYVTSLKENTRFEWMKFILTISKCTIDFNIHHLEQLEHQIYNPNEISFYKLCLTEDEELYYILINEELYLFENGGEE